MPEIVIFNGVAEVPRLGPHHHHHEVYLDLDLDLDLFDGDGEHTEAAEAEADLFHLDFAPEVMADLAAKPESSQSYGEALAEVMAAADCRAAAVPSAVVAVSPVAAAVVPDVDDQMTTVEPHDDEVAPVVAAGIEALKMPTVKRRRKKRETPAVAKTAAWLERRKKNNRAAALNRAKEKAGKLAAMQAFGKLKARNTALRAHVADLEATLAALKTRKNITNNIFAGLDAAQFSLTPPALPLAM